MASYGASPIFCCTSVTFSTCHAERSEASGLTNRAAWPTPDASLPLRMTRQGAFLIACHTFWT